MKAKLICYGFDKINPVLRTKFKREFFGYIDKSNNSKYEYRRKGLLNTIPCIKLIRSVIIVKNKDVGKVKSVLDKYDAQYYSFDVSVKSF